MLPRSMISVSRYLPLYGQGKCMKNRAVTEFVEPHGLILLWLYNDFTHGSPYVSAVSSSLFIHHSRLSPILESATLAVWYSIFSGLCGDVWLWRMGRDRRFWPLKLNFLRQYGNFTGGIPSHDTLARVMALINADQLQTAFAEWMKACHDVTEGAVVAIDGKTLRGFYCRGKGKGAIHMISAFSAANGVV